MTEDFKKGLATGLAIGGVKDSVSSSGGGLQVIDMQFDIVNLEVRCVTYEKIEEEV